jgi:hypothetical protein
VAVDVPGFWQHFCGSGKIHQKLLVEHHEKPFWAPLVKLETILVFLCKEQAPLSHPPKMAKKEPNGIPSAKGGRIFDDDYRCHV